MKHIKSITLFSAFLFCMNIQVAFSQSSRFSINKYVDKGDTLNYRQLFPDSDPLRKYPLVIFLHGSGERGNDNEAQLKWGVMNLQQTRIWCCILLLLLLLNVPQI